MVKRIDSMKIRWLMFSFKKGEHVQIVVLKDLRFLK
jgi:hypothetical protein